MQRQVSGLTPEQLLDLFEQALGALWRRAHIPLGEVTLTAIVDRVLHVSAERFPLLSTLRVERSGIRWDALRDRAGRLAAGELEEGFRFVLVEFLTILGNLTAEILTPALHAEISKVRQKGNSASGPEDRTGRRARSPKETRG